MTPLIAFCSLRPSAESSLKRRVQQSGESGDETMVEFFSKQGLKEFLLHGEKSSNGVVQKFVESRGAKNTVIRATWSPQVCVGLTVLHNTTCIEL